MNTVIEINQGEYKERVIVTEGNKYQVAETFRNNETKVVVQGDVKFETFVNVNGELIRPCEEGETLLVKVSSKGYEYPMIAEVDHLKRYTNNKGTFVKFQGERWYDYQTV